MRENVSNKISTGKNNIVKEIFAVGAVIFGLIVLQWRIWVTGELMVTHDSISWYGVFQYFVECLQHGFLPLWNPYMNCGEPFFLNINILHLLDPSTLLLILIGKFLGINLLALYHYDLLLRYIIFICGAYLFFRYVAKYKISALIGFLALSFSSLCISYLRQHAFILSFYLLPWILLSILKFLEERNPKFLLWIAFFLGIVLPSYHSIFLIICISVLLICLLLSKGLARPEFRIFFRDYKVILGSFFIFFLLAANLLPNYLLYTQSVVPTVRIFEAPLAAHSLPADFLNLLNPYGLILHFFNPFYMSESFLYIGLVPFLFAIIGLCFSRHKYKLGFICTTIIIVLLMLGDVFKLISKFFPVLSIIRNMHTFGPFFIFCLTFFTCLGADVIFEWAHTSKIAFYKRAIAFFVIFICFLIFLVNNYIIKIYPGLVKNFSHTFTDSTLFILFSGKSFLDILKKLLFRSYLNLFLFAVGGIIFFSLFQRPKLNINFKYSLVIFFIIIDLFLFNFCNYKLVALPRINAPITVPKAEITAYSDFRVPVIQPRYPFYAFAPAMLKIFTAYSTKIPWTTTHFYEMKDFFEFINNQEIPDDVKNVLMGISSPKLRLIDRAVVLSRNQIFEEFKKIDTKSAEKLIFIEGDLPIKYSHLKGSLDNINSKGLRQGDIKVRSFSPNEIVVAVYSYQDSFLYYSDGFDKAWRVFVDGKEEKVYKTNLAFKSVIVDKGNHIVRFVYDPKFYKFTLFCYLTGLLSLLIISFFWIFNKYKYVLKYNHA